MNIVFVGHVDHGKSTVIGRLLADTGALPVGKLEQIRLYCERNARPFEYAFLIDALKDERRQNITIDAARVFFQSPRRRYIIIDAPGHIEFVKNMVTGAARAEAALLVIDAQEGVQENSRRHGNLLTVLGIRQVVVLINKMDLAGYSEARFGAIRREYADFLHKIGLHPVGFIPVSAREGDNISQASANLPWYQGPTVLQALDAFEKSQQPADRPFRMPVQDVYRFTPLRIVAGSVSSGTIHIGDEVVFYPSGKRSSVQTIETFGAAGPASVSAPCATGFTLSQQIYIQRGEIAARAGETPPEAALRLRVSLFWLGKEPLVAKKFYTIKLATARTRFQVESFVRVVNASSLDSDVEKVQVDRHEMAECILSLDHALAFDRADVAPDTSRFVVVDGYEIRGGGMILEGLPDTESWVRERVRERNARWIASDVTQEERAERYSQRAGLVIITGRQGVGRKRLARALEAGLFRSGRFVYYLGMGSVVYGVAADIPGHSESEDRREHIRRLAEVANILLDAGLLLIVTAVELTQADLKLLQTVIAPERIETVWVGETLTTDIACDLWIEDCTSTEQAVARIKQTLQEHGLLYRP
ncbi:MAG: GTP-binding protein [Chloroflexota bacterium]